MQPFAPPQSQGLRPPPSPPSYSRGVPAVAQASQVLFYLAGANPPHQSLTAICRAVGIHKSKGYALLNTLRQFGLVVRREGTKTYALGPGLLVLSRSVLDHSDLQGSVAPFLETLSQRTACTALLGLVSADHLLVAAKHEAATGMAVAIRVGHRYPLTWGAHGKILAAFLPEAERRAILAGAELYFWGDPPRGAPGPAALSAELETCRALGYATDFGAVQAGVSAASAPLIGSGGRPIGAVMVVGTFPPADAAAVGEHVSATARELSTLLGPTLESLFDLHRDPPGEETR